MLAAEAGTIPRSGAEDCASIADWMKPVQGPVISGYGMRGDTFHYGADISAAKGTPIHAAASGIVIQVRCEASLAESGYYSCGVDGDPVKVRGCDTHRDRTRRAQRHQLLPHGVPANGQRRPGRRPSHPSSRQQRPL
jgi:hypothetical protein